MSTKKLTQEQYLERVKLNRDNTVEVLSKYFSMHDSVKVKCLCCNNEKPWYINARQLVVAKYCPHKYSTSKTNDWYKQKLKDAYGEEIVAVSNYVNARTKIMHICTNCNCEYNKPWSSLPQNHTTKPKGCPKIDKRLLRNEVLYKQHIKTQGFELVEKYIGIKDVRLKHKCLQCGNIELRSVKALIQNHITKYCTSCNNNVGYSAVSILWLEKISQEQSIYIQHARNGGEYKIPGTRMRVDGFCEQTNTIYEFYGDIYHGNVAVYGLYEKPNPFSDKTALYLYNKTMKRENTLKRMGYKVISIWERDFKNEMRNM